MMMNEWVLSIIDAKRKSHNFWNFQSKTTLSYDFIFANILFMLSFGCVCVCVEGNVAVKRVNVLVHSVEERRLTFSYIYSHHSPLPLCHFTHSLSIIYTYVLTHVHTYTYFMVLYIHTYRFESDVGCWQKIESTKDDMQYICIIIHRIYCERARKSLHLCSFVLSILLSPPLFLPLSHIYLYIYICIIYTFTSIIYT